MNARAARTERHDRADSDEQRALKLGFLINDTARLRRVAFDAVLRPLGFTTAQASVLRHLSRADGMSQSELALQLELGKVSLGETVNRLAAAGLVCRSPDDSDRRSRRIHLTPAGRAAVTRLRELAIALNEHILEGVGGGEVRAASQVLENIKANLLRMTRGRA